jgi:membrane associated rhomboid family serine protease
MIIVEGEPIQIKGSIVRKFPYFLFLWTIVLISVFVFVDKSNYAYGCRNDVFQWRILTYHMFHLNIEHIVCNVTAFWLFGLYINMVYNDITNIIIYVLGVILSACTYHLDCDLKQSNTRIIGASGGICAIVGAVFVTAILRFWKGIYELGREHSMIDRITHAMVNYMISFTTIGSVFGMITYDIATYFIEVDEMISHIAHFGGYIAGAFIGLLITLNKNI